MMTKNIQTKILKQHNKQKQFFMSMEILKDFKEKTEVYYVISLRLDKQNSKLLDENGLLKKDLKRSVDYDVISLEAWNRCKHEYKTEIKTQEIYNLYITFSYNGLSYKKVLVHSSEHVFDVIQTLFVNKMYDRSTFNNLFDVRYEGDIIDPDIQFSTFGNTKKILLVVSRSAKSLKSTHSAILESMPCEDFFTSSEIKSKTVNKTKNTLINPADQDFHSLITNLNEFPDTLNDSKIPYNVSLSQQIQNLEGTSKALCDSNLKVAQSTAPVKKFSTVQNIYSNLYTLGQNQILQEKFSGSQPIISTLESDSLDDQCRDDLSLSSERKDVACTGLINIGNTCYMNSSIQCLKNCKLFSDFFVIYNNVLTKNVIPFSELKNNKFFDQNHDLIKYWSELIVSMKENDIISPRNFKSAVGRINKMFADNEEQDAAEFITSLLGYIHEGLCYKSEILSNSEENITDTNDSLSCNKIQLCKDSQSASVSSLDNSSVQEPQSLKYKLSDEESFFTEAKIAEATDGVRQIDEQIQQDITEKDSLKKLFRVTDIPRKKEDYKKVQNYLDFKNKMVDLEGFSDLSSDEKHGQRYKNLEAENREVLSNHDTAISNLTLTKISILSQESKFEDLLENKSSNSFKNANNFIQCPSSINKSDLNHDSKLQIEASDTNREVSESNFENIVSLSKFIIINNDETINSAKHGSECGTDDKSSEINHRIYEDIFRKMESNERSIVSNLFYGMYTNFMKCRVCQFSKEKNELWLTLVLPIPMEVKYHFSVHLSRVSVCKTEKVLAPLSNSIEEIIEKLRSEDRIPHDYDTLAIEYGLNGPIRILPENEIFLNIKNRVVLFEFKKKVKYYLCNIYCRQYYFFKKRMPIDILIVNKDVASQLYNTLKYFLLPEISISKFIVHLSVKSEPSIFLNHKIDPIFNLPVIDVFLDDLNFLFGRNFNFLDRSEVTSNDISLSDCLAFSLKSEVIELHCEKCKIDALHNLTYTISKVPRYLIIQLKRFSYDRKESKINTFVDFPLKNFSFGDKVYNLIATANHIELNLGYGHYISYILVNRQWYCCNDSVILKVNEPDKSTAYIMFYEMID